MINTHLHFDHAGGNTFREVVEDGGGDGGDGGGGGAIRVTFPRATYVVQRGELEFARHTNERTAASYLAPNFEPVSFTLVSGEAAPLPGIRCLPTPGHVPFHQSVLIESAGERVCFLADLVPTAAHLPLPWIPSQDLYPLDTLAAKKVILPRAIAEQWLVAFTHDVPRFGHIREDAGRFVFDEVE